MPIDKTFIAIHGKGVRELEIKPLLPHRVSKHTLVVAPIHMHAYWRKIIPDIHVIRSAAYADGAKINGFNLIILDECQQPTWDRVLERANEDMTIAWVVRAPGPERAWATVRQPGAGRPPVPVPDAPVWVGATPPDVLERLRAIRLYHWREMLSLRQRSNLANGYLGTDAELATAFAFNKAANLHLGFVQALNDLFPIDETAEYDDALARNREKATAGDGEPA